jgi:hypothetical protein
MIKQDFDDDDDNQSFFLGAHKDFDLELRWGREKKVSHLGLKPSCHENFRLS